MRADLLAAPVPGLDEALDVVTGFDRSLVTGLLRPPPAQAAALDALAAAVAATPLAGRVAEAAGKAAAGTAGEDHFAAIAAARAALLGAVHDGLLVRVDEATGRRRAAWTAEPANPAGPADEAHAPPLRAAARSWLSDLARAGWRGLDRDLVAGSAQVIAAMLADLRLRRLSALLDGFAAELAASCPIPPLERIPERRWADLWSRAMLLAQPGAARPAAGESRGSTVGTATGRLLPLGIDLHEHATAAQAQVHAVFEPADGGPARLVRASVSAPKPDTVVGMGVWHLLRPHMSLLAAYGDGRSADIAQMPITREGDLLWDDEHARPGPAAEAFATARVALAGAVASAVAPADRHPVRISEPVFLEGYTAKQDEGAVTLTIAGQAFAVDLGRLPSAGPLTPALVAGSTSCIALLRWDAGSFAVQPLAVQLLAGRAKVRQKTVAVHAGAWAGGPTQTAGVNAEKAAAEAVAVLRERAGRLLRR